MGNQVVCCSKEDKYDQNEKKKFNQSQNNSKIMKKNGPAHEMTVSEEYYNGQGTFAHKSQQEISFGEKSQVLQDQQQEQKEFEYSNVTKGDEETQNEITVSRFSQVSNQQQLQNPEYKLQDFKKSQETVFYSFNQTKISMNTMSQFDLSQISQSLQKQQQQQQENDNDKCSGEFQMQEEEQEQDVQNKEMTYSSESNNMLKIKGLAVSVVVNDDQNSGNQSFPKDKSIDELKQEQKYTQQQLFYIQQTKECIQVIEDTAELVEKNHWDLHSSKGTMTAHHFIDRETGFFSARVEEEMRVPDMETFIKWVSEFDERIKNDEMFESGKILEQINDEVNISHQKYKGVAIVKPRDFVVLSGIMQQGDNVYLVAKGLEDYQDCPETKSVVRAKLNIAGWIIKPIPGRLHMYNCIYLSQTNPVGKIPMMIKKNTIKFVINMIKKLKEKCEKEM